MTRYQALALWAIPYSMRWDFSKLGINYDVPDYGRATNKTEAAFQHAISVAALASTSLLCGPVSLVLAAIVGVVKIKNLLTQTIN